MNMMCTPYFSLHFIRQPRTHIYIYRDKLIYMRELPAYAYTSWPLNRHSAAEKKEKYLANDGDRERVRMRTFQGVVISLGICFFFFVAKISLYPERQTKSIESS